MRTLAYSIALRGLTLLAGLGLLFINSNCHRAVEQPVSKAPQQIENYSQLGWIDSANQHARISDLRGKVLVLDFYATWCEPCRRSIPKLNQLQQQYGPAGLVVVGLNVGGPDDRVKVKDFAREWDITYELGFPEKSLTELFFADNDEVPQTFVFTRRGELSKRFIGYDTTTPADLQATIKTELERTSD